MQKRRGRCNKPISTALFLFAVQQILSPMSSKLKDILAPVLLKEELQYLVGSYDVVGDIAIVVIAEELVHRQTLIGEAILSHNKNVKVVLKRAGNCRGEFRTRALEVIAGRERTETLVTEFGVRLLLDVERTYFSVRSGSERKRIACLVQPQESVLVMFSGVGPYPLLIARHSEAVHVVGVEKNPLAHEYAMKNLLLNKKITNVSLYLGDTAELPSLLTERFDRIVMPLPTMGHEFLPVALEMLGPEGGWLHYYEMAREGGFERAESRVQNACDGAGKNLLTTAITRCGHCGPRTHRICVDSYIVSIKQ